jgi:glutamine amidotransferase
MKNSLKIAIVNYEVGNTRSVKNAFERFENCEVVLTDDKDLITNADAIILPGVGAYPDAVKALKSKNLIPTLEKVAFTQKKPFLAICLGMQLLFESSEEGQSEGGLGWIPGKVVRFNVPGLHVPHFGWNDISINIHSPIFKSLSPSPNFYFAHSYHASCLPEYVLASCNYGISFPAIVKKDNVFGMQFHPEKSHSSGMLLLSNFINYAKEQNA